MSEQQPAVHKFLDDLFGWLEQAQAKPEMENAS